VPPAVKPRRFPPPWSVEELNACFVVRDDDGLKLLTSISRTSRGDGRRRICSPKTKHGELW